MNKEIQSIIDIIKPEYIKHNHSKPLFVIFKMLIYYTILLSIITYCFQNKQNFSFSKYQKNIHTFIYQN
jgi:hypothetical protein